MLERALWWSWTSAMGGLLPYFIETRLRELAVATATKVAEALR